MFITLLLPLFQLPFHSLRVIMKTEAASALVAVRVLHYRSRLWIGQLSCWSFIPGKGKRFLFPPQRLAWLWSHPCSCPLGTGLYFLGHETGHLSPSSADVKNDRALPSLPHMSSWRSAC